MDSIGTSEANVHTSGAPRSAVRPAECCRAHGFNIHGVTIKAQLDVQLEEPVSQAVRFALGICHETVDVVQAKCSYVPRNQILEPRRLIIHVTHRPVVVDGRKPLVAVMTSRYRAQPDSVADALFEFGLVHVIDLTQLSLAAAESDRPPRRPCE